MAHAICRLIDQASQRDQLPASFLTRLIWAESSFRSDAVSPAGAQGIAQFMPGTAAERHLSDPFDPEQAIAKSAQLLAELKSQFGNLGLAAAAYNAGPLRVQAWLDKKRSLPLETQTYVLRITGRAAEDWAADLKGGAADAKDQSGKVSAPANCMATAAALRVPSKGLIYQQQVAPWGVQLAGNFSKTEALATYARSHARYASVLSDARPMIIGTLLRSRGRRPFYRVRIPEPSRAAADAQCQRIRSVGGSCAVLKT